MDAQRTTDPGASVPGSFVPPDVIAVSGLSKSYGAGPAVLSDVSFRIGKGERVALIGANGSGKSTLLKSVIGLHPVSGGAVQTLGIDLAPMPPASHRAKLRQQIGFVFQKHCLVRRLTALSNVVHGMLGTPGSWRAFSHVTAPQEWRDRAQTALEDVRLGDRALTRADTLSGGQQQRVAIARAMVRQPSLLIADEPAASLDPVAGREVMELFSRICADHGITLLFTSHDMDHALAFADRIIALKGGRVALDQPAASVSEAELRDVFDG